MQKNNDCEKAYVTVSLNSEKNENQIDNIEGFFGLSSSLLCTADFDRNFIQLSPAWEQLLGYPMDYLLARPIVDFIHEDDLEATIAAADRLSVDILQHIIDSPFILILSMLNTIVPANTFNKNA